MYKAIHKCKLCKQVDTEEIHDSEFDLEKRKYPLRSVFKYHQCEDGSIGVCELIGFKKINEGKLCGFGFDELKGLKNPKPCNPHNHPYANGGMVSKGIAFGNSCPNGAKDITINTDFKPSDNFVNELQKHISDNQKRMFGGAF